MRLDKLLANKAFGSRKEVHRLIKSGFVTVNGDVVIAKDMKIDEYSDFVAVNGTIVNMTLVHYIKLNKPKGYVTAVEDNTHPTVMELLPEEYVKQGVFPVGRLDKDTEGLILLTNDGQWGHRIIHGKKHVPKVYDVYYEGTLTDEGVARIREGIILGDGTVCKPAEIEMFEPGHCQMTIEEGKYHQVKRMIGAAGGAVVGLKRLSIGTITLADIDEVGAYQALSIAEINVFTN